ncbi:skin secretory protein xP2-like [Phaenicophaeus curvirostris]|uniref:skin secretory protein xP2-like n=1 Tax=Phaenicophaeus curvirostris TaxID=33595 RepID=UPI0037F0B839
MTAQGEQELTAPAGHESSPCETPPEAERSFFGVQFGFGPTRWLRGEGAEPPEHEAHGKSPRFEGRVKLTPPATAAPRIPPRPGEREERGEEAAESAAASGSGSFVSPAPLVSPQEPSGGEEGRGAHRAGASPPPHLLLLLSTRRRRPAPPPPRGQRSRRPFPPPSDRAARSPSRPPRPAPARGKSSLRGGRSREPQLTALAAAPGLPPGPAPPMAARGAVTPANGAAERTLPAAPRGAGPGSPAGSARCRPPSPGCRPPSRVPSAGCRRLGIKEEPALGWPVEQKEVLNFPSPRKEAVTVADGAARGAAGTSGERLTEPQQHRAGKDPQEHRVQPFLSNTNPYWILTGLPSGAIVGKSHSTAV